MKDAQKLRFEELKKIAEADLTAEQKVMLDDLKTIETQDKRITDQESFIGVKSTELATLKTQVDAASPEDKAALELLVADKQAVIDTLKNAMEISKDANERIAKTISVQTPGDRGTVDQKTVDALEDTLFAAKDGKEAMEKAVEAMTDSEYADFTSKSDLTYRKKVMSAALSSVGGEETVRFAWRKKDEDKGIPAKDAEKKRLNELFGNEQRQHRRLIGGGGGGILRRDTSGQPESNREVDIRAH